MTRDDLQQRKARREQELAVFIERANDQIAQLHGSIAELTALLNEWPDDDTDGSDAPKVA